MIIFGGEKTVLVDLSPLVQEAYRQLQQNSDFLEEFNSLTLEEQLEILGIEDSEAEKLREFNENLTRGNLGSYGASSSRSRLGSFATTPSSTTFVNRKYFKVGDGVSFRLEEKKALKIRPMIEKETKNGELIYEHSDERSDSTPFLQLGIILDLEGHLYVQESGPLMQKRTLEIKEGDLRLSNEFEGRVDINTGEPKSSYGRTTQTPRLSLNFDQESTQREPFQLLEENLQSLS